MNLLDFTTQSAKGFVEINFAAPPKQPAVSVIVQTYQHVNYIEDCLKGIVSQKTTFPFEVLLGDDLSTDGTREICLKYAQLYPNLIRLFLHDRSEHIRVEGRPTGRFNLLTNINNSRGEFIAICEGDDYWCDTKKLQIQHDFLKDNTGYAFSFHRCLLVDETNSDAAPASMPNGNPRDKTSGEVILHATVPTLSVMFRTNLAKTLPEEFKTVFNADAFMFAWYAQGGHAKYHPEIEPGIYRKHEGGIWSTSGKDVNIDSGINTYVVLLKAISEEFRSAARDGLIVRFSRAFSLTIRPLRMKRLLALALKAKSSLGLFATVRLILLVTLKHLRRSLTRSPE